MLTATLTSKGQLTLPKALREAWRLKAGGKVTFALNGDEAVMRPVSKSVDEIFGLLRDEARPPLSVEDMDAAVRRRMKGAAR